MKFYNTSYYIQANEMTEAVGQLNLYSAPIVILFYNGKEIHRQARIIDFSELDYRIKQTGCIINGVDRRNFYQCHFFNKKS